MRVDSTGASRREWGPPADEAEPLYDPYFGDPAGAGTAARPDGPTAVRVGTASWSLALGLCSILLAPITAPLALALGLIGLRRARRLSVDGWDATSARRRARAGIALAVAGLAAHATWIGFAVFLHHQPAAAPSDPTEATRSPRVLLRPVDPDRPIPQSTEEKVIGKLHVVTLGAHDASLREVLRRESDAAEAAGDELLVIVVGSDCEPCDGLQASLPHPLMQEALAKHRVLFVDNLVYASELIGSGFDPASLAGFYLLGPDLRPRDAVHGGEWGEDVAANIAPVLGPFVRGELARRRYDWRTASEFPAADDAPAPARPRSRRGPLTPTQPAPPPPSAVWL